MADFLISLVINIVGAALGVVLYAQNELALYGCNLSPFRVKIICAYRRKMLTWERNAPRIETSKRREQMTRTVTIRIRLNKNGKRVAHYWGLAKRWLPISVEAAELAIATGVYGKSNAVAQ